MTSAVGFGRLPNSPPIIKAPIAAKINGVAKAAIAVLPIVVEIAPATLVTKAVPLKIVAKPAPKAPPIVLAKEVSPVSLPIKLPTKAPCNADSAVEAKVAGPVAAGTLVLAVPAVVPATEPAALPAADADSVYAVLAS